MNDDEARARLREARIGRMATVDRAGVPHVIPVVFAAGGDTVYWTVDTKRKGTTRLKRLRNIEANPNVEIVVDHYDEDWSRLWWVRAAGTARVVDEGAERDRALHLLRGKYPQHASFPPRGAVVAVDVARISGWSAS